MATMELLRAKASITVLLLVSGAGLHLLGCGSDLPPPYEPPRPISGPQSDVDPARSMEDLFLSTPEVLETIPPPVILARMDAFLRVVHPSRMEAATVDQLALLGEREALETRLKGLRIGALDLIKARLRGLTGTTDPTLQRVAAIRGAQAVTSLKHGTVEGRVRARSLLEEALTWDPSNPLVAILLSRVLKTGSYHARSLKILDRYGQASWGKDLLDLERLRAWIGEFQTTLEDKKLDRAIDIADKLLQRRGPRPWVLMERAHVLMLQQRWTEAKVACKQALRSLEQRPLDKERYPEISGVADLYLGYMEGRDFEFHRADSLFRLAVMELDASSMPSPVLDLMKVPWDLLSPQERLAYDHVPDRERWLQDLWRQEDPILATPHLAENQVFYWSRIARAMVHFSRMRLELRGPETAPGRAVLRFGWPSALYYLDGQTLMGTERDVMRIASSALDFSVYRDIVMEYDFRWTDQPDSVNSHDIIFQDRGGDNLFTPVDSLVPPHWPPRIFDLSFRGRYYPAATETYRFQEANGSTELLVAMETLWPDLTVPYPLSGLTFRGTLEAQLARYELTDVPQPEMSPLARAGFGMEVGGADPSHGKLWATRESIKLPLDSEYHAVDRGRTYRRRFGTASWSNLSGSQRIATMARLRNDAGKIVGLSVNNGKELALPQWPESDLAMSDILFAARISNGDLRERDWEVRPGVTAYGIPRDSLEIVPRASMDLLPGEDLYALFEVYNLEPGSGVTNCEVRRVVEKLNPDSTVAYGVGATDNTSTLIRFGINWWVVYTGIGLPPLEEGAYRLRIVAFDRNAFQVVEKSRRFNVVAGRKLAEAYPWHRLKPEEAP